ncbi:hypothetical protein [Cupriavidus basilensis]|uniref:hypothetical protein n=1 Tax=Cupriavidus basilensis TaxID=68895 RepID=UPI0020A64BCB|nr:hypothetical protein [Cupriavidus basilensis]MCP3017561.1 hypothetical protein [Cupriavidus basilensis]
MDRLIVYPGQIPLETDLLNTNKYAMIALAKLSAAMLGTAMVVNGLGCVPTGPASLQVVVNPGEVYSLANIDATAYSSLPADTTHSILKQGISLDPVTLSCPAPATAGQSVNYLIQVAYLDTDAGLITLPYYNASNPTQAWAGPGGSGAQQATARKGIANITAKAGVSATTGAQVTPAPDAGYTGLWVVTVANGQTAITSANIAQATNAPILPADLLHAVQQSGLITGVDTGAANAYAVSYTPAITALTDGMVLWFKAKTANTGASTLNVNGLGAQPLIGGAHSALQGGEIVASGKAMVVWRADISAFVLLECTGAALQVGAGTQSQHAAQVSQVQSHGMCRLAKSGANLVLSPLNGNRLIINGVTQAVPAAGVSLAPAGLTASTVYYIYAYMNAGAMTLEASATGHSTDSNTGVEIKTGDVTRTLVGMEYASGTTTWAGLCRSWFNDPGFAVSAPFTAGAPTASTSYVELNSAYRAAFLLFAGEIVNGSATGTAANSSVANCNTSLGFDSAVPEDTCNAAASPTAGAGTAISVSVSKTGLAEGYHYLTVLGSVSSGTGTWGGSGTKGTRTVASVYIAPRK